MGTMIESGSTAWFDIQHVGLTGQLRFQLDAGAHVVFGNPRAAQLAAFPWIF